MKKQWKQFTSVEKHYISLWQFHFEWNISSIYNEIIKCIWKKILELKFVRKVVTILDIFQEGNSWTVFE